MPADRLYYHVKLLQRAGLIVANGGKAANGRSEAKFDVPGRPVYLRYDPASAANRRAVGKVVESILRTARRDFVRALTDPAVKVSGKDRNLWTARIHGNLSKRDLVEVNDLFHQLITLMSRSSGKLPPRGKLHQLTFSFSPTGRER
jgi:hypothetical protein